MQEDIKSQVKSILFRIGDFLRTDIRYLIRQGGWLFFGQIIGYVLSFGVALAFANLLPKETFGVYKYILSIFGILLLTSLSDMGTAVTKAVVEGHDAVYRPALAARIHWGFWGSVGSGIVALYYFLNGNTTFGYSFLIAAVTLPFFDSTNTYLSVLAGKKRFDLQATYYTLTRIGSSLALIATLFFTDNILFILLAYTLPYIILGYLLAKDAFRRVSLNSSSNPGALELGKHLSFIAMIWTAVNQLDNIIVFQLLGPVSLAVYSIALAPIGRVQSLFGIVPEISVPKFAEQSLENIRTTIHQKLFRALFITVPLAGLYIVFIPYFFRWFLPQYIDAIPLSQLLAIPLAWYPQSFLSRIIALKGGIALQYRLNIIESALQLIIMFGFTYYWGLTGAVLGRIAISAIGALLLYYFFFQIKETSS